MSPETRVQLVRESGDVTPLDEARAPRSGPDAESAADAAFLTSVSREVRTALNSIMGFAQLLREGHASPLTEPQAEDIELVIAGGRQLMELVESIVDLAMVARGSLGLVFAYTPLRPLFDEVIERHRPYLSDPTIALDLHAPAVLPDVLCDRRRIAQVLDNLVANAVRFTEHGRITLDVESDGLALTMHVADTGVGLSPTDAERPFRVFPRLGELKQRRRHTGLGLAISREIATHHGGSLSVRSERGGGATFTLAIPIEPRETPCAIDLRERASIGVTSDLASTEARRSETNYGHPTHARPPYARPEDASDRLRGEFLAEMSHDLRSPLTSILGFSELLLVGVDGDLTPEQRTLVELIQRDGRALLRELDEILDFSKLEAGSMKLQAKSTLASEVVAEALAAVRPLAPPRIRWETQGLDAPTPLLVDAYRVSQALEQLMRLASTRVEDGRIDVTVGRPALDRAVRSVEVRIATPCPPASVEELQRMRAGFVRLPGRRGLGLGLSIAVGILEGSGGALRIEEGPSTDPEHGMSFVATLPCA